MCGGGCQGFCCCWFVFCNMEFTLIYNSEHIFRFLNDDHQPFVWINIIWKNRTICKANAPLEFKGNEFDCPSLEVVWHNTENIHTKLLYINIQCPPVCDQYILLSLTAAQKMLPSPKSIRFLIKIKCFGDMGHFYYGGLTLFY